MYNELLNKLKELIKEIDETTNTDFRIINEIMEIIDRLEEYE